MNCAGFPPLGVRGGAGFLQGSRAGGANLSLHRPPRCRLEGSHFVDEVLEQMRERFFASLVGEAHPFSSKRCCPIGLLARSAPTERVNLILSISERRRVRS